MTTEEMFALVPRHPSDQRRSEDRPETGSEERIERYDPIAIAALYARQRRENLLMFLDLLQHRKRHVFLLTIGAGR